MYNASGIKSIIESGVNGVLVTVECHLANSLPNIVIVGFTNRSISEARERIRSALASCKIKLPTKKIILNLAPADIPKEGSSFDLPMLISILWTAKLIRWSPNQHTIVMGEVGLDGSIRPIRGVIGKILAGKKLGFNNYWIPKGNLAQASLVPGVSLKAFSSVKEVYQELNQFLSVDSQPSAQFAQDLKLSEAIDTDTHLDDIVGQQQAKRALLIAAAGHHNIMISGPPGTGKSMLAKALPSIMSPLTQQEILEVTHLHSLASKNFEQIITSRPFRAPHHSASSASIIGGGNRPLPGEISLSHYGVLFMDEFPEFSRPVIEALRQPLEDKKISVARSKDTVEFPAQFLLVATANPCPCGFADSEQPCQCSAAQIKHYQKKLSGPIIDRIDLFIEVEPVPHKKILKPTLSANIETETFKKYIAHARKCQINRGGKLNSELTNHDLKMTAQLETNAENLLNIAADHMKLSARAYIRTLRVARTVADLDNSESITQHHISEALQYRRQTSELTSVT